MKSQILQRWFNAPPVGDTRHITDDLGNKFWINWNYDSSDNTRLHIWRRGRCVGVVYLVQGKEDNVMLVNIIIFGRHHYRSRGLGKAMLREIIRWARENEFKDIRGVIKAHDGSAQGYMEEWYRRQGFIVKGKQILYKL